MSGEVECTLSRVGKHLRFLSSGYDSNAHDIYTSLFLSFFFDKINMTKMHVRVDARSGRERTLQDNRGGLLVVLLEVACIDRL